jgi:hypothetical protein
MASLHYHNLGLLGFPERTYRAPLWTSKRVNRLCQLSKCTPWELAATFLMPPKMFLYAYEKNSWPSHFALLMQQHEADLVQRLSGAKQDVLPDVLRTPHNHCEHCGGPIVVKETHA